MLIIGVGNCRSGTSLYEVCVCRGGGGGGGQVMGIMTEEFSYYQNSVDILFKSDLTLVPQKHFFLKGGT